MSNKEHEELCGNLSRKELQSLCKKCGLPARKSTSELAESLVSYFRMSNKEREALCRNLSRKELQILCKKCGLPARKSRSVLAESLVSYFQNKDLSLIWSGENLNGNQGALFPRSVVQTLQPDSPLIMGGNAIKDGITLRSCTREDGNTGKGNIDFNELKACIGLKTYEKDGFDRSMGNFHEASQFQFISRSSGRIVNHKEHPSFFGNMEENASQFHCLDINVDASSEENASPMKTTFQVPAFEYYVSSEEGIKLCVDLTSSPSDWIKKYKNQIYICENLGNNKGRSLQQELGRIGESNQQMNGSAISSTNPGQIKDGLLQAEYSPSSVMEENFHVGIGHPDGGNISMPLPLIPQGKAVDTSGCSEKDQGLLSSKLNSNVQNPIILSTESWNKNRCIDTLNLDVPDAPVEKTACNFAANSVSDGSVDLVRLDHQNSKPDDGVCEISILRDSCNLENTNVGPDDGNSKPDGEVCENSTLQDTFDPGNNSFVFLGCLTNHSAEMQFSEAGNCHKDASCSPLRNGESLNLIDVKHNSRIEQDALANSSEIAPCGNHLPSCSEEQAWSNDINQRESSVCSGVDNSFERTWLKYNAESSEEYHKKRMYVDSEDQNGCSKPDSKVLRIVKHSAGEGTPRRSMRLFSKVQHFLENLYG